MERLAFVGPGRVGLALGNAIVLSGQPVELVYFGRRPEPPSHPLFIEGRAEYRHGVERPDEGTTAVFLTIPDAVLPELAFALAGRGIAPSGCCAFHCSGALGADPLAPLHHRGYSVGTLHPLQAVASTRADGDRFEGTFFAISGEPGALRLGRRLVGSLGGTAMTVPTSGRPLYHAAAVMASNYLVVLLEKATEWLCRAGASHEEAGAALAALARGSLENISELGPRPALTGPISRGDVETVELHLRALDPEDAALYVALGLRTLELVRVELDPEAAARLDELFERYG